MGKWLNELRKAGEISGNGPNDCRQNRQNPVDGGFVSSVSRSSSPHSEILGAAAGAHAVVVVVGGPKTERDASTRGNGKNRPHDTTFTDSTNLGAEPPLPVFSNANDFEERAALVEDGTGAPREWCEGFARLDLATPPTGFDDKRWRTLLDDGGRFLDRWGAEAARLGWSAEDVFGVHPIAPGARYDAAGLVVLIDGGAVVAIGRRSASIRTKSSGATLIYLRTPRDGSVCAVGDGRMKILRG
jgi:hypothetical protein